MTLFLLLALVVIPLAVVAVALIIDSITVGID